MKVQILLTALAFSQPRPSSSSGSLRSESQSRSNRSDRIIGGSEAVKDRYSYAVSLQSGADLVCGGSLIAKDVVLTAAHCLGAASYVVVGRRDRRDNDGEVIIIETQLPHPDYDWYYTDNDFMLVFLSESITANVDLVKLNGDSSVPDIDEEVTVMGWGNTNSSEYVITLSDELMEVQVKVISNDSCEDSSGRIGGSTDSYRDHITQNMLCAKAEGKDSCQGDSGGPLVVTDVAGDVQVGVVSWGIGCASEHFPGVYARISEAYYWIESEVCKGSQHASGAGFDCGGSSEPKKDNPPKKGSTDPVDSVPAPPPPSGGGDSNDNWLPITEPPPPSGGGDSNDNWSPITDGNSEDSGGWDGDDDYFVDGDYNYDYDNDGLDGDWWDFLMNFT